MYQTKIKSIKKIGEIMTYDLHTPEYHNFLLTNGILSKNSGKSWGMLSIAYLIDPTFEPRQIAFSFREVMKIINSVWFQKKKWKIILFDEPQTSISNRQWQSLTNRLFNFLLSTFRHQNVILLFATPYADFIDVASQKLLHCKFEVKGHSVKTNLTTIRPKLLQYNSRMKKFYEHSLYVMHKGKAGGSTKLVKWNVPKPPQHLIDPYEEKKSAFTHSLNKDIEGQLDTMETKQREKDNPTENNAIFDTGEPTQFLSSTQNQWLEYIKTHPNLKQKDYAKIFKRSPVAVFKFLEKCREVKINVDDYLGK